MNVTKFMTITGKWEVYAPGLPQGIVLQKNSLVTVENVDFVRGIARIHVGGLIHLSVKLDAFLSNSRPSEPDEIQKELKLCQRCGRIELSVGWVQKPKCFRPREGVVLVPQNCPDCDD